ncbi:MAG: aromatic ring-hydroxylating dioxygenase subunit alpha [Candidatus Carbobacillus altaicus]|uniref:Large subunit naph/bph dioxygenase n=1 Tax=Candidatus Carbonibacillus altaicus TaxID=2163959 RepID=A0A2R6XZG5_9BACL|nr:aromatic ring-hydroxylating dioxygenase subunit alpha [Candidatus Carbobacillus altaicus]PTQ55802.1 MAG: Large subunit naph/bph dioxygenase [Candidatus Carbobacillus altaicus]
MTVQDVRGKEFRLSDGTRLQDLLDVENGYISARIVSDPELYELEMKKIFARVWVPIAHVSEIPNKGDYVLRYIGDEEVIVARSEHNTIHVVLNACTHRGMPVCRSERGNSSHFRCPYHGFTYRQDGQLIGVPAHKEAFGEALDKELYHLVQAKVAIVYGLIFATFNDNPPPIDEYLGTMKWYLQMMLQHTPEGMEVIGVPQRWVVKSNWKLGGDNFVGDAYHTFMTHYSAVQLRIVPSGDPKFAYYGVHVSHDNGHGLGLIGAPPEVELPRFYGVPEDIAKKIEATLPPGQQKAFERLAYIHGTIFPNMSFGYFSWATEDGKAPGSYLTLRQWVPRGPYEMEVFTWVLAEKEASDAWKHLARETFVRTFGASGMLEQDDAEMWSNITRATKGFIAREKLNFIYRMGINRKPEQGDWPGPGTVYQGDYSEQNQLNIWRAWARLISE